MQKDRKKVKGSEREDQEKERRRELSWKKERKRNE